jgi:hypothetical protein
VIAGGGTTRDDVIAAGGITLDDGIQQAGLPATIGSSGRDYSRRSLPIARNAVANMYVPALAKQPTKTQAITCTTVIAWACLRLGVIRLIPRRTP